MDNRTVYRYNYHQPSTVNFASVRVAFCLSQPSFAIVVDSSSLLPKHQFHRSSKKCYDHPSALFSLRKSNEQGQINNQIMDFGDETIGEGGLQLFFGLNSHSKCVPNLQQIRSDCKQKLKEAVGYRPKSELSSVSTGKYEHLDNEVAGFCGDELFEFSLKSQEYSMCIESLLRSFSLAQLDKVLPSFIRNIHKIVPHSSGTYVAVALTKTCRKFQIFCESYCIGKLDMLVTNKCAVKVMQALAGVSSSFCDQIVSYFAQNQSRLSSPTCVWVLLNKAILKVSNEQSLQFLTSMIEERLDFRQVRLDSGVLRVLSSILERCSTDSIQKLVVKLQPHICRLIDDKIGNYSVQVLLSNKYRLFHLFICEALIAKEELSLFINPKRLSVMLRTFDCPHEYSHFYKTLICQLIRGPALLAVVVRSKRLSNIFQAILSHSGSESVVYPLAMKVREQLMEAGKLLELESLRYWPQPLLHSNSPQLSDQKKITRTSTRSSDTMNQETSNSTRIKY